MDPGAKLSAGIRSYQDRRYDDAKSIATEILQADAGNFRALNLLGMSLCQQGHADEGLRFVARAVEICPEYAAAHNNLATIHRERGIFEAARRCIERAIELDPVAADFHRNRAAILLASGEFEQAIESFKRCIELDAGVADAYLGLGDALSQLRRFEDALAFCQQAIALQPDSAEAYNNRGNALHSLHRAADALDSFDRALALQPDYCEALSNRGNVLRDLKRPADALASFERALALKQDYPEALNNCGNVLRDLDRRAEALASYDRALALKPEYPEALNNRGIVLGELRRPAEALASFERAIALKVDYAEVYNNRGIIFGELKQHAQALTDFEYAISLAPDYAEAWSNRGNTLRDLKRHDEALASFDRALSLKPDNPDAHYSRAHALRDLRRYAEAVQSYSRVVELSPEFSFAKGHLLHAKMLCCDWGGLADLASSVRADIHAGRKSAEPFGYQGIADSPLDLRTCAEIYAAAMYPRQATKVPGAARMHKDRIRIGYVSGEFRQQATSVLMAELFERHDKSRFEIFAFDNGWDDKSEIRARIDRAFDEIVDISNLGDLEAAAAIRAREIDILVNLNGYFGLHRQGVFSHKPSPIQVNYLGFPGTIGADYIDYIVADKRVIPPEEQNAYVEKVVYLPDSYQVNDSRRRIAERAGTRREHKLPAEGFVFCCFNNNYKITPEIFAIWMRLLQRIEGSVLWLLEDNVDAARNLRNEASRRGVSAERLVFAPRMDAAGHLARHRLADLFLDTLPYNAHTTASDALWAGLPLLTCRGTTFPGRVATSLLNAVGLTELIGSSLDDYERRAVQLAAQPTMLADVRARLARNRSACRLFDTIRFCRHFENAYAKMWQRYQDGQPPEGFAVGIAE